MAVESMLFALGAIARMSDTDVDLLLGIGHWLTLSFTGPVFLAGLIAFATSPPVTDVAPVIGVRHGAAWVAVVFVLSLAAVGIAFEAGLTGGL